MKFSTKTRYGIRAMLELALNETDKPLPIATIAERQGIPEAYLEQLMGLLKKNGLVISARGAQGGYMLAASPQQTSVASVIKALEGSLAPVTCLEDTEACSHSGNCAMHLLYGRIMQGMDEVLSSITLQDMVNDQRKIAEIHICR